MAKNALVILIYLLLSLLVTWPLALHLNNFVIDRYDGLLITWIQNWWLHRFSLDGNIFYPLQNTLAFSDYHLVSALLAAPFVFLFKEPLLAFNVNLILGLALTSFAAHLLAEQLTKKIPVSFLTGIILGFSTIHLNYMAHSQLFHLWLLLFSLLFVFQKRHKLFLLFFVLSVVNSALNLYFLLFLGLILRQKVRWFLTGTLLSAPFLLPYFWVSRQFGYQRPITDVINFSLQFPDLTNVSIFSRFSSLVAQTPNSTPAYFGAVFLILIFLLLCKSKLNSWLVAASASFVLALGPALHIFKNTVHFGPLPAVPLPYAILYYLVPGFSGFRTPSRWIIITAFSLAMAIAVYFAKKITWPWTVVLTFFVLAEVNFPFKYYLVPMPPPEQIWLQDHFLDDPVIQFPIYGWFDGDQVGVETLRQYYSTIHWHPMFNGYSGFSPPEWENRVRYLQREFPSPETIKYLRDLKMRLVLAPASWQIPLKLVASFPDTKIYDLNSNSD